MGLIGLAQRAGKCVSGSELCEKTARDGGAKLMLLDRQTRENTASKIEGLCARSGIPLFRVPGLGHAIGKEGRMVCAVTDAGFARAIRERLDTANNPGV
jgi:ribosomal protein L7Ae-like RNA K-turn-binding protein